MNLLTNIIKYPAAIVNAAAMHFYILHKKRALLLAPLREEIRPIKGIDNS